MAQAADTIAAAAVAPTTDSTPLKRTPLYDVHVALGARMVPFGGWEMPVQYPTGVLAEHQAVRDRAGLFDIGHMGQFRVEGPDAREFLQWVTTHDVARLEVGAAQYSLLCNEDGGVLDDVIVYRLADTRYLTVVNAANADSDFAWLEQQRAQPGRDVDRDKVLLRRLDERTLLALQGPRATRVLRLLMPVDPGALPNYHATESEVAGVPAMVARTGYTGERGYEVAFDRRHARRLWDALLDAGRDAGVVPCGLGARDTLRLEAGMALYSHELTADVNPFEAGLERVVHLEKGDFIGAEFLRRIAAAGPLRRLVGVELLDRGVLRAGYPIVAGGRQVGQLTSGGPSPTLKKSIGMGYVPSDLAAPDTGVAVEIRGRPHAAKIAPLPFYKRPRR
jgi:aminomethyltransferase